MVWLAAARMSVWPSGAAFATEAVPMVPPAPGRFSTMTLQPSAAPSSGLIARARMSCTPPAPNGTTMRVTLLCAAAAAAVSASGSTSSGKSAARIAFTDALSSLDAAPVADERLVDLDRLPDALHAAIFVGLVRKLRLARAEHHRGRARIGLEQIPRVGIVAGGARLRRLAEMARADLEHALHPLVPGRSPYGRRVLDDFELDLLPEQRAQPREQRGVVHPWHRAHVHADARRIRHRVDRVAALDRADVERRRAHDRMHGSAELERLELRERARRLVDRVHAQVRHRAVRRNPAESRVELDRPLVADQWIVGSGLADYDRAGAAEELRHLRQMVRADAPALLRRGEHDDDARRARKFLREVARREQDRRDARFHVGGAAPVEPVAIGFPRERIARPGPGAERYRVDMPGEAQGRPRIRAARARNDARAALGELVVGDAKAPLLEQRAEMPRAVALAAGRIDRVEA